MFDALIALLCGDHRMVATMCLQTDIGGQGNIPYYKTRRLDLLPESLRAPERKRLGGPISENLL